MSVKFVHVHFFVHVPIHVLVHVHVQIGHVHVTCLYPCPESCPLKGQIKRNMDMDTIWTWKWIQKWTRTETWNWIYVCGKGHEHEHTCRLKICPFPWPCSCSCSGVNFAMIISTINIHRLFSTALVVRSISTFSAYFLQAPRTAKKGWLPAVISAC